MIDSSGATVVEYTYDSWGKPLSCTGTLATILGVLNPFRYRGYVYDEETQWYYLRSRYYDPETCRFISADVYLSTGQGVLGHNCYAYCRNNPISRKDKLGMEDDSTNPDGDEEDEDLSILYNVPLYIQRSDLKLCWAYCQLMIEAYRMGYNDDKDTVDNKAIGLAQGRALFKNSEGSWNRGRFPKNIGKRSNIKSITELYGLLKDNGPLYGYYKTVSGKACAHLVVITGVDVKNNLVCSNNPWGPNKGVQTFEEFLSGVAKEDWQDGMGLELAWVSVPD